MIRQIGTIGVALLVAVTAVVGVTAALPGAPADDAASDDRPPAAQADEANETAADPPSNVPAFVGEIHDEIASFDGGEQLGAIISALTPGEDVSEKNDEESEEETTDGETTDDEESGEETTDGETADDEESEETDGEESDSETADDEKSEEETTDGETTGTDE